MSRVGSERGFLGTGDYCPIRARRLAALPSARLARQPKAGGAVFIRKNLSSELPFWRVEEEAGESFEEKGKSRVLANLQETDWFSFSPPKP